MAPTVSSSNNWHYATLPIGSLWILKDGMDGDGFFNDRRILIVVKSIGNDPEWPLYICFSNGLYCHMYSHTILNVYEKK